MDAPEILVPSPWRTLGRTLLQALAALVILALIWLGWSAYATHRLESQMAIYHSRGEPSSVQDFIHAAPLRDQNAYEFISTAFNSLSLSSAEEEVIYPTTGSSPLHLPLSETDMTTIEGMLKHSTKTQELIHRAGNAPMNVWPFDPKNPLGSISYETLGHYRKLADYSRILALYYHQSHQDHLALQEINDIISISNSFSNDGLIIGYLIRTSVSSIASQAVTEITPSLQLQSVDASGGSDRNELTELMRKLLDVERTHRDFIQAIKSERVYISIEVNHPSFHSVLLAPAFKLDAVRGMGLWTNSIDALNTTISSYAELIKKVSIVSASDSNLQLITHLFSQNSPDFALFKSHYRGLLESEAAGLRIAIRSYELDHDGQLPPSLPVLVPHYLPTLPVDFFNPKGDSFVYVPERRLFYSLNFNGTDEGGKGILRRPGLNWGNDDATYPLDWPIPASATPPSTTVPKYLTPLP